LELIFKIPKTKINELRKIINVLNKCKKLSLGGSSISKNSTALPIDLNLSSVSQNVKSKVITTTIKRNDKKK
jgi:hypothetical protein